MTEPSRHGVLGYDYRILIPTLLLLGFGLVAIYSASSFLAEHKYGDSYFYLKRQGIFCLLGLCFLIMAKNIPTEFYSKLVYPGLLVSSALLAALLIPGVGMKIGGASRWLRVGGLSFQPSELAKLSLALYIAYSMSKKTTEMSSFTKGFIPHLLVTGIFMGLIVFQPDLGSCIIIGTWLVVLLFVGGVRMWHLGALMLACAPVVILLITKCGLPAEKVVGLHEPLG